MSARGSVASLGEIMQLAYVPADFDQTLKFWIETVGAGPFFAIDHVQLENVTYFGAPVEIDFSMVIGYWGDLQGREGLHHVCILVDDMAHARDVCAKAGAVVAQEGLVSGGGEVIYVDTGGGPGTMVEILKPGPGSREFFAMMRDAARDWDGTDPVRKLG